MGVLTPRNQPHTPSEDSFTRPELWSRRSWRGRTVAQPVNYSKQEHLEAVCDQIRGLPGLVTCSETSALSHRLEQAALGKAFIIQGGDCAEAFEDVKPSIVGLKQSLLVEQASILSSALNVPVVAIGRIAGQYSKPRSQCHETLSCGSIVNAYRGDNVNSPHKLKRLPDPERMLLGYHYATATLLMLRMGQSSGFEVGHNFFTSHEALHLPLEEAQTRDNLNASAHMLWIGERSRDLDGAHVEYARGLRNPVGIKLGPKADPAELIEILERLNPEKTTGKITLITRFGANNVEPKLQSLIRAVQRSGHRPVWLCDPMHGNTFSTVEGVKTRSVQTILKEIAIVHRVHQENASRLGGLHLEQTGEDVTECVQAEEQPEDLTDYRSLCDPRLSRAQALRLVSEYSAMAMVNRG